MTLTHKKAWLELTALIKRNLNLFLLMQQAYTNTNIQLPIMPYFHVLNVDFFKVYMNIKLEKAILVKMFFFKDKDGTSWDIENNPQSKNGLLKNVILQFQRKFFS